MSRYSEEWEAGIPVNPPIEDLEVRKTKSFILWTAFVIFSLCAIFTYACLETVPNNEIGISSRDNERFQSYNPGLHFIKPYSVFKSYPRRILLDIDEVAFRTNDGSYHGSFRINVEAHLEKVRYAFPLELDMIEEVIILEVKRAVLEFGKTLEHYTPDKLQQFGADVNLELNSVVGYKVYIRQIIPPECNVE